MEVRVRIDASRKLGVAFDKVRVLQVAEQTWPDERLGCSARKLVVDPVSTPGFRIGRQGENHPPYLSHRSPRRPRASVCGHSKKIQAHRSDSLIAFTHGLYGFSTTRALSTVR